MTSVTDNDINEFMNHFVRVRIPELIRVAQRSTCHRSKCGAIIITPFKGREFGQIIGEGFNSMPCNETGPCFKDELDPTFKSDRTCCVHAEQRAIMDALQGRYRNMIKGSLLYFLRLDMNDTPVRSGEPYCSICSKMALDVGISHFFLWRQSGWMCYDTKSYNELTFKYKS